MVLLGIILCLSNIGKLTFTISNLKVEEKIEYSPTKHIFWWPRVNSS